MKAKSFIVTALVTERAKKTIAEKVDEQINTFLQSEEVGEVVSIAVDTEFSGSGEFGKAFVTVVYKQSEPAESKEPESKEPETESKDPKSKKAKEA